MKRVIALITLTFSAVAVANSIYQPTEKEIEFVKFSIQDDAEAFFMSGESAFNYGDFTVISPEKLHQEYEKNEVRADKNFKGKKLIVSGVISKIQSGLRDEPSVVFKTKKAFQSPQANFAKTAQDKVIDLDKGQEIHLVCVGGGEIAGTPLLIDCLFSEDVANEKAGEYFKIHQALIDGKVDIEQKALNKTVFFANVLQKITNNFSKCQAGKITSDCIDKSINAVSKKFVEFKNAIKKSEMPEQFRELADYLHLSVEDIK